MPNRKRGSVTTWSFIPLISCIVNMTGCAPTSPIIAATTIMIECKNYSNDISNPELDQIAGRFSNLRGWFGIIMSRHFDNKDLFVERCKDTAKDGRGIILCLDDADIIC